MAWQDIAKNVAPVLAGALPPPFGALASIAVKGVLGLDEKASDREMEKALATASPETLLKLKEVESKFIIDGKKLDVDLERLAMQDRDSARSMKVQTKTHMPDVLSILITIGFFFTLYFIFTNPLPEGAPRDALLVMLGSLGTAWTAVVSYWFGSTVGSKVKTELMGQK